MEEIKINDRIAKLGKAFQKMEIISNEVDGQQIYVAVTLPSNWVIDEKTGNKFNIQHAVHEGVSYFWGALEDGVENVFEAIDYTIEQNRTAQEKANLFEEKVKELRDIFTSDEYSIEQLRALKITVGEKAFTLPLLNQPDKKNKKDKKEETILNE